MKRLMKIILYSLLLSAFYCANLFAVTSATLGWAQEVVGFVEDYNSLLVTIDESVLPFDLSSPAVAENTSFSVVRGLRIGTIDMTSNAESFTVSVSHDRLRWVDPLTGSTAGTNSIDYRLDIFYGAGNSEFISVRSMDGGVITETDFASGPPYAVASRSIYVSLSPDISGQLDAQVEALPAGQYISDITFNMVAD
ncbi:MAG: hypothetical protein SPD11_05660 [Sphaerochaetaceae bacterium]|nr:hypothetical protein [Sphaerochaetaceae bacterium]